MEFTFFDVVTLLGGLALFIYGMGVMGQGLEKVAGQKLHAVIEAVTGNIFKSVLVGAAVTAAIQSSSATTVMVVGFVNAGIMNLRQAVGVIMGANIGTTMTALLISLNSIQGGSFILQLLKPTTLAPLAIIAGVLMASAAKRRKVKEAGQILVGFGVLFTGMQIMEGSVSGLRDLPQFQAVFATLTNPILGVLAGAGITAVIQSSSASVGILQAVATTGAVTYGNAIPIIMGQNIGTCVTAMLSSIGASKNAKRAAFIHLYFNLIGSIIFLVGIYSINAVYPFQFWEENISSFNIAQIHIIFNVANTILMIPFSSMLVRLANATVKDDGQQEQVSTSLDERFLKTPGVALEQCRRAVEKMGALLQENYGMGMNAIMQRDISCINTVEENEAHIDKFEFNISQYLVKLNETALNDSERKTANVLLRMVNDFERIGDHCDNFAETANDIITNEVVFSKGARRELSGMFDAVREMLDLTMEAFGKNDVAAARRVEPLEDIVDRFKNALRDAHVQRLNSGKCTVESGVSFLEIVGDLERIADHCMNVSFYVLESNNSASLDMHEYFHNETRKNQPEYLAYVKYYEDKYYNGAIR
ncbi:MAG: Na/Pi cotransporter family protein [Eubacteriales bacterium]|jgi:phosphate:Na+ symporter